MLPIRDSNPTRRTAWVTLALIAANVIVFLIWEPTFAAGRAGQLEQEFFFLCHAEVPWEVTHHTSLAQGGHAAVLAIDHSGLGVNGRALQLVLQGHANLVNGVPANKDLVAPSDSPVVRNLKKAGAIVIGLTNTPEFSFRGFTDNPLHGLRHG